MINVIGLGYIGLPTALMLSAHGQRVVGTDCNPELISRLNNGRLTFRENGMELLFYKALAEDIRFTTEYESAEIYIISVPTPYDAESKKIDPTYVVKAVKSVSEVCPAGAIIVVESTVSPGTLDKYIRPVLEKKGFRIGIDIHLAHAPERIIPGQIIKELRLNSRTIGTDSRAVGERLKEIYSSFCQGEIVLTTIRTAEMTKVVENTFRDINIAFANELAKICHFNGLDVYEIIKIANRHPRVNILAPGPGVGGHCIPVDPWFLVGDYPQLANLTLAARRVNDSMPEFVLQRLNEILQERNIRDVGRVGFYGLTYKENVDDIRDSPTLQMIESMEKHMCYDMVKIYDPFVQNDIVSNQKHNLEEFLDEIDVVVIMVAHNEIRENMQKLKGKIILDTRNVCCLEGVYRL